ncbi:MAG: PQQ-binding-like beta-propeller repeat protein [Nevskiaceae bacterium]|jgi:PQQ-dependent dehydrogenase (methanol/ethanol family)|nr:PQQ-binding-like beta-propeller repeat protein [Nevskiaceae bacterium]
MKNISVAVVIAGLMASSAAVAATPGGQNWPAYNNKLDGQRYSPLKQITPENVAQLGEVCRVQIDGPTANESGLIVIDGVIYTTTGFTTVALDATNCAVKWINNWQLEETRGSPLTRGLAVDNGRVFRGTPDGRLIALDAKTGELLWKTVIAATRLNEGTAAAPLAWGGMVYMGISGSESGVRGRVMAYDQATGKELWRFNTIPMGDEKGAETWEIPKSAKTGGGGVWGAMTLDVTTGELFVPVGNPWPDISKADRPGDNLFTNSIVVLDARTGALKWWHQSVPADWQDFDIAAPPVLYRDNSQVRDLMVFGGKDGFVTAVDRDTNQRIFRTPVTTVEQAPLNPSTEGIRVCPGYAGGVEWNGPALDLLNNTLVTGAVDSCFIVTLGKAEYGRGANFGGTVRGDGQGQTGWITSIDAFTGEVRWKYHAEKATVSGITPTAGGVTFAGDFAGNLLIFDSKSGELLRKWQTGGALAGGLVTYEIKDRQYVAFGSGNVARGMGFGSLGMPSVIIMSLDADKPVASTVVSGGGAATDALAHGQEIYIRICTACHGPDGDMIADRRLSTLAARSTQAQTVDYIKKPKDPMPAMYPQLLKDADVADVAEYLHKELQKSGQP